MKRFLKENWIWIATPIVLVVLFLVVVAVFFHDDDFGGFIYNLW